MVNFCSAFRFMPVLWLMFVSPIFARSALHLEIERATQSINHAKIIDEVLYLAKVQFHEEGAFFTTRTTTYSASDTESGPIEKIIVGYVTSADIGGSGNFTQELVATSNLNQFAVEVNFRSDSYIPPAIRSKKVIFFALGLGANPEIIDKSSLESGDATDRSITDFICSNPTQSSNTNSTNTVNDGLALGHISLGDASNSSTNILRSANNAFSKCYPV